MAARATGAAVAAAPFPVYAATVVFGETEETTTGMVEEAAWGCPSPICKETRISHSSAMLLGSCADIPG